tara:strand:+ start:568 stop:741 length:174 start_codon:yes stop_codon:yes gene_type:complete
MKKRKKVSKNIINPFAIFVKEMEERTPVSSNSGKGIVKDETVARIQDIYKGEKKGDA